MLLPFQSHGVLHILQKHFDLFGMHKIWLGWRALRSWIPPSKGPHDLANFLQCTGRTLTGQYELRAADRRVPRLSEDSPGGAGACSRLRQLHPDSAPLMRNAHEPSVGVRPRRYDQVSAVEPT